MQQVILGSPYLQCTDLCPTSPLFRPSGHRLPLTEQSSSRTIPIAQPQPGPRPGERVRGMEHNWTDDGKDDGKDDDDDDDDGSCYDDDDHLSVGDTVRIVDGHHTERMGGAPSIEVKEIMKDGKKESRTEK